MSGRWNGWSGEWSARPTAQTSVMLTASTPENRFSPADAFGVDTTVQVAANAGLAGSTATAMAGNSVSDANRVR